MYTIIDNEIHIFNPSLELSWWVKENLVVPNPTYQTLVKLGKIDTIRYKHITEKLSLFRDKGDELVLPYGTIYAIWKFIKDSPVNTKFNNNGKVININEPSIRPLYDYQQKAVDALLKAKGGVLVAPCSAGKTDIMSHVIHDIGQKFLFLVHTSDLLRQFYNRIKMLYPSMDIGIINEGEYRLGRHGAVATIQTMAKLDKDLYKNDFDVVICDECFPKGTSVKTIDGYKNIEDIKLGDLVASFNHKTNTIEYKPVTHLFVKTSCNLTKVNLCNNISIVATSNHPFYTQRGYVALEDLKDGDYVLQNLWERSEERRSVQPEMELFKEKGVHLLFKGMLKERILFSRNEEKVFGQHEAFECYPSFYENGSTTYEMGKSYENCPSGSKNDCDKRKKWNFASTDKKSRRKREDSGMPKYSISRDYKEWTQGYFRVSSSNSSNKRTDTYISNMLQNRYCFTREKDSDRSGWKFSPWKKSENEGQKENRVFKWVRVESVQGIEQCDSQRCESGITVYNLEVADNNNYFVQDILVHNCVHVVSSPTLQKMFGKVVGSIPARYKFGCTATPSRGDGMIKSMYTILGANENGDFAPTYTINKCETKSLTALHTKLECNIPFDYRCLASDGTFNYNALIDILSQNQERNDLIINTAINDAKQGEKVLILCHRVEHCKLLNDKMQELGQKSVLLVGKVSDKKREAILNESTDWDIIVATYSLAKEGLDLPCLTRLIMATPIADKGMTVQCVGRIERFKENKETPIAYDIYDTQYPYCVGKWKKRDAYLKRRY